MAKIDEQSVMTDVRKRLDQEPAVADPSKITVDLEKRGSIFNRRYAVIVSGRVASEAEGNRIASAVQEAVGRHGSLDVENRLVVPLV